MNPEEEFIVDPHDESLEILNNEPFFPVADNLIITFNDVLILLLLILLVVSIAFIVNRILLFVPSFICSFRRTASSKYLDTTLDRSEFGIKNLFDRWFPW